MKVNGRNKTVLFLHGSAARSRLRNKKGRGLNPEKTGFNPLLTFRGLTFQHDFLSVYIYIFKILENPAFRFGRESDDYRDPAVVDGQIEILS